MYTVSSGSTGDDPVVDDVDNCTIVIQTPAMVVFFNYPTQNANAKVRTNDSVLIGDSFMFSVGDTLIFSPLDYVSEFALDVHPIVCVSDICVRPHAVAHKKHAP